MRPVEKDRLHLDRSVIYPARGSLPVFSRIRLIQKALRNSLVRVDSAVAQKRPVLPRNLDQFGVEIGNKNLFAVVGGLGHDAPKGIGNKTSAPELQTRRGGMVAGTTKPVVSRSVMLDAPPSIMRLWLNTSVVPATDFALCARALARP